MKDLYTFDWSEDLALRTYEQVTSAYSAFFDELKIPIMKAQAASGAMGGTSSHEYHLRSPRGEDEVVSCGNCGYTANVELAEAGDDLSKLQAKLPDLHCDTWNEMIANEDDPGSHFSFEFFLAPHNKGLVVAVLPRSGKNDPLPKTNVCTMRQVYGVDTSIRQSAAEIKQMYCDNLKKHTSGPLPEIKWILEKGVGYDGPSQRDIFVEGSHVVVRVEHSNRRLRRIQHGDKCPNPDCRAGVLAVESCIELGHTFHLGTRYSDPLHAEVDVPELQSSRVPYYMGCHGIGISRLIAGVADLHKDEKGFNWPRAMAPFEVALLPAKGYLEETMEVYDILTSYPRQIDCVVDDRKASFGSKIIDAELIGYPVIVTVGHGWQSASRTCLIQFRRPYEGKIEVPLQELKGRIQDILDLL